MSECAGRNRAEIKQALGRGAGGSKPGPRNARLLLSPSPKRANKQINKQNKQNLGGELRGALGVQKRAVPRSPGAAGPVPQLVPKPGRGLESVAVITPKCRAGWLRAV